MFNKNIIFAKLLYWSQASLSVFAALRQSYVFGEEFAQVEACIIYYHHISYKCLVLDYNITPFVSKRPALELTEDELKQLETISKSRTQPKRSVERSKILLRFHEGKSISQIAQYLGTIRPEVERAISRAFLLEFMRRLRTFQEVVDRGKYHPMQEPESYP